MSALNVITPLWNSGGKYPLHENVVHLSINNVFNKIKNNLIYQKEWKEGWALARPS